MVEKRRKRGLFIVAEGIDGSGKSTQAEMLFDWLKKKGQKVILTREPYTKKLKKQLREGKKYDWLALFSDDRKVHLKKVVMPSLQSGKTIICDRYYYSTLAYQLPQKEWKNYSSPFRKPDIALIFDVPVGIAMKRRGKRDTQIKQKRSYFEKTKILEKVRKNYLKMPLVFKEVKVIDARGSIKEIFRKVKKIVG